MTTVLPCFEGQAIHKVNLKMTFLLISRPTLAISTESVIAADSLVSVTDDIDFLPGQAAMSSPIAGGEVTLALQSFLVRQGQLVEDEHRLPARLPACL